MLIEKKLFTKVGGFDEDYFACLDDTDLGWRLWLYGYSVLYCPASIAYHVAGGTAGRGRVSSLKTFHGTKDSFLNILKNLEPRNLLRGIGLAIMYDFAETIHFVKCRDVEYAKMKAKAYNWVAMNLRSTLQKRHLIQKNRKFSDEWLLGSGVMASFREALIEYLRLNRLNLNA